MVLRADGWWSALTKLGTAFDKLTSFRFAKGKTLTPEHCSDLYYFNPLAAKVCSVLAEDAMREGVCIRDEDGKEIDDVQSRLRELDVVRQLTDGAVFGAVYGAGGVYLGVEDGLAPDQPLDVERVTAVQFLRVIDRRDLAIRKWYQDPLTSKFNTPELYSFVQTGVGGAEITGTLVHESRFILFAGTRTGQREANRENAGWPFSKLQRLHDQLLRVGVSWDAAAQLLQTSSQTVMKINGLREAIASDKGAEALEKRAQLIDAARSITRSLWIDSDGEEVEQLTTSLAGVGDIMDRLGSMLAAASEIPVTKLFGTMPTGLGATGDADERTWNNRVESYREQEIKPKLDLIVSCIAKEVGVKGDIDIEFPSLDRPTEAETSDIRLKTAQTDQIYVNAQVVLPEEIAISRFGGARWSMETQLKPGPRDELEFPAPPGSPDPAVEQDLKKQALAQKAGGSAATNPKARSDEFDPSQARDEHGMWSAGGVGGSGKLATGRAVGSLRGRVRAEGERAFRAKKLQSVKNKFAKARDEHATAPTLKTEKKLAGARDALKRRRIEVGDESRERAQFNPAGQGARPDTTPGERESRLAAHKAAHALAREAHAEAPSRDTAEHLERTAAALREARRGAGKSVEAMAKAEQAVTAYRGADVNTPPLINLFQSAKDEHFYGALQDLDNAGDLAGARNLVIEHHTRELPAQLKAALSEGSAAVRSVGRYALDQLSDDLKTVGGDKQPTHTKLLNRHAVAQAKALIERHVAKVIGK